MESPRHPLSLGTICAWCSRKWFRVTFVFAIAQMSVLVLVGTHRANGQTNALGLEIGVHYYAISNLSNPTIPVLRGEAGSQGYAHDLIILAPNTQYREWILHLQTMRVAVTNYTTPDVGRSFQLPEFQLRTSTSPDSDGDGLHDLAEFILGTIPNNPDSDGDGILDGVEIQDGTDPLDGLPASIGIIAATDTPGTAVDVCAINDLAVVANREAGVSVLNVAGQNPIRIAEVDTPGTALRVACFGNLIAVADGAAGLAIIDITDPPAARILHQVNLGSPAQAVAAAGGLAYAGLANGETVIVDLASGTVLERLNVGGPVYDIGLDADYLFVLIGNQLMAYRFGDVGLEFVGSVATSGFGADPISQSKRLFVGGGRAYVTSSPGYDVIDITNPASMEHAGDAQNTGSQSFKQIISNGSGLGVATIGATAIPSSDHDVLLYDLSDPAQTTQVISGIQTPGIAYAASIYNGRAYVADGASGLQVINYLAYDSGTNPPSIALSTSFTLSAPTNGLAEEGKLVRVTAGVTDDVQVRNVEFYLDGARVLIDGNFPFEHRFLTPRLTTSRTNFTVRAKATDTGGNFTWSDEILVELTPDATPPRVLRTDPGTNSIVSITNPPSAVFAYFNEPMQISTLGAPNYRLIWAGSDHRLGTDDDQLLTDAVATYRDTINAGVLEWPTPLGLGVYQGIITTNVTDAAGNHLEGEFHWTFAILTGGPNGDDDADGLTNADEIALVTNPFNADTDGDGWSDLDEVENDVDPTSPKSRPQQILLAFPPVRIELPSPEANGSSGVGIVLARPPVTVDLPSAEANGTSGTGIILARPPIQIDLPSPEADGTSGVSLLVGKPPVSVIISNTVPVGP